jgi:beta-lactamase regulating signal transducer with metallopeptidase domain
MIETRIAVSLLNAVWQGALVVAVTAFALRAFGRTSASVRCAVWSAALAVVVLLPVVDAGSAPIVAPAPRTVSAGAPATHWTARRSAPAARFAPPPIAAAVRVRGASVPSAPAARLNFDALARWCALALGRAGALLFWMWIAGVAICGLRLLRGAFMLNTVERNAEPLAGRWLERVPCARPLRVAASASVSVPCLVGFIVPTVVIPRPLVAELKEEDLRRIVLHEVAHAERFDHWVNLFVQVARAALFFNPVVAYIARRIAVEREIACDDRVIEVMGDRVLYAACLTAMARNVSLQGAHPVPGFLGGRAQIVVRVEELLDRAHDGSSRLGRRPLIALAALAALAAATTRLGIPVVAAQADPAHSPTITHTAEAPAKHATPAKHVTPAQRAATVTRVTPVVHGAAVAHAAVAKHATTTTSAVTTVRAVTARRAVTKVRATKPVHAVPRITRRPAPRSGLLAVAPVAAMQSDVASPAVVSSADAPANPDLLDTLQAQGYRNLSVDQLIELRDHGVDGTFIAAMNRAVGRRLAPEALIALRDHGVDATFARQLAEAHVDLPYERLIALRDHGVDPAFVAGMQRAGYAVTSGDELIRLHDLGITPAYASAMNDGLGRKLPVDELVRLHNEGIDAAYVQHIRSSFSGRAPSTEELIKLRNSGL